MTKAGAAQVPGMVTAMPITSHSHSNSSKTIEFQVDAIGGKYRFFDVGMQEYVGEGASPTGIDPVLQFVPGFTYIFKQDAMSSSDHPLWIVTADTYSVAAVWSLDVNQVVTPATATTGRIVTVKIPEDASATDLWYACEKHPASMSNEADIVNSTGGSDFVIELVTFDEEAGTLELEGRDDFPTAGVDLTKASVNINGTPVTFATMADAGTPPAIVDDTNASNDGALVVKLSSTWLTSNTALLKDTTVDTVDVEAGFAAGVAALTSGALTVLAARPVSDFVIELVTFDEEAGTLELEGRDDFPTAGVDLTKASVNINGTPVTFATMADAGTPPAIVDDTNASNDGALVVKLSSTWLTSNTALLKDTTVDTVDVEAGFAAGVAALTSGALTVLAARPVSDFDITHVTFDEEAGTLELEEEMISQLRVLTLQRLQ